jgi:shikimate 5-dehydrogenase
VLVVGAGGAARAAVLALARAGGQVTVAARRPEAAASAAHLAGGASNATLDAVATADFEVVINATPLGMAGESLPLDPPGAGQWAVDLVYHPEETPFLAAAAAAGASVVGGLGMLVHQAALGFEAMTGRPAPLGAMREAARGPGGPA